MFSISESQEREQAEGQEEGVVAQAAPLPWQSPHRRVWGAAGVCLEPSLRMK